MKPRLSVASGPSTRWVGRRSEREMVCGGPMSVSVGEELTCLQRAPFKLV
jgi:hypothetical protein